jgi:chromosome partitioning protein
LRDYHEIPLSYFTALWSSCENESQLSRFLSFPSTFCASMGPNPFNCGIKTVARKRDLMSPCFRVFGKSQFRANAGVLRLAIITFAQVKGGSGKTTAAMCTVAELVARGTSAAALDLDPNRPLGEFFQRVPELKQVEVAVPTSERRVSSLVRELSSRNDNVVIDLMGAATNDTQVAMALADLIIVPSQMSGTDLKCGVETWRQAAEAADISNRTIARAVLLARTSAGAVRPRVEGFLREQYERVGAHVLATSFGDRAVWKEMTYSAHIPHLHDRASNAAKNFISVFDEMMTLIGLRMAEANAA